MGRAIEIKYKLEDLIIFSLTFQNLVSNYIRREINRPKEWNLGNVTVKGKKKSLGDDIIIIEGSKKKKNSHDFVVGE